MQVAMALAHANIQHKPQMSATEAILIFLGVNKSTKMSKINFLISRLYFLEQL